METETQKLIYPGNHGQASYCHYKIGFDDTCLRPKVVVLIWDAKEGCSTPIINNSFTDDVVINRIFERGLKGISVMDILIVTPRMTGDQELVIKKLPIGMFVEKRLGTWGRVKQQFGLIDGSISNISDKKCGELLFNTGDPVALSDKEKEIVVNVFPEMDSINSVNDVYQLYCNTPNTRECTA